MMSGRPWPSDFEADEWTFVGAAGVPSPMTANGCPTATQLLAAEADVLPPELAARIATHLTTCPRCQELLATLRQIEPAPLAPAEEARIRQRIDASRRPTAPWRWPRLIAAPVAALALISIWLGLFPSGIGTATVDPKPLQVAINEYPASAPTFVFEKPSVVLPLSALIFRGESNTYATRFGRALSAFRSDNYASAVEQFDALARESPRDSRAQFYVGVSRLLTNAPTSAVPSLRRAQALGDSTQRADATWYLAHALYRSGDRQGAAKELAGLCGHGGPRSDEACGGLLFLFLQHR